VRAFSCIYIYIYVCVASATKVGRGGTYHKALQITELRKPVWGTEIRHENGYLNFHMLCAGDWHHERSRLEIDRDRDCGIEKEKRRKRVSEIRFYIQEKKIESKANAVQSSCKLCKAVLYLLFPFSFLSLSLVLCFLQTPGQWTTTFVCPFICFCVPLDA